MNYRKILTGGMAATMAFGTTISIVSCGESPKTGGKVVTHKRTHPAHPGYDLDKQGQGIHILTVKNYNALWHTMGKKEVILAVIANFKTYTEHIPTSSGDKLWNVLQRSTKFEFKL